MPPLLQMTRGCPRLFIVRISVCVTKEGLQGARTFTLIIGTNLGLGIRAYRLHGDCVEILDGAYGRNLARHGTLVNSASFIGF